MAICRFTNKITHKIHLCAARLWPGSKAGRVSTSELSVSKRVASLVDQPPVPGLLQGANVFQVEFEAVPAIYKRAEARKAAGRGAECTAALQDVYKDEGNARL